jgi:hypothetical protein
VGDPYPRKHGAQRGSRCLFFLAGGERYRPLGSENGLDPQESRCAVPGEPAVRAGPETRPGQSITVCSQYRNIGRSVSDSAVDIARMRGKLLISPAPGSLAGPAGSSGSGYVMAGASAASRPWVRRGTRTGRKGSPRSSGWTGGWAWKGPGHPVDNGDQARGQRDCLRSEGAARVLFSLRARPWYLPLRACSGGHDRAAGTNPGPGSLCPGGTRLGGGEEQTVPGWPSRGSQPAEADGDIMACTVGD